MLLQHDAEALTSWTNLGMNLNTIFFGGMLSFECNSGDMGRLDRITSVVLLGRRPPSVHDVVQEQPAFSISE